MLSSIISSTDCWLAVEYASSSWPGFRELVEAGVGKALPRPEERADDEGVRSSSLEEVVCDGPSLGTEGGARGTTPDAFGGDTSFGAMVSIASFKRGAAAPFRHCEPFGSNDKRGRGADLGGAGGVGGAARSLGQTWVPTEVFGDTPPDTRLQEAGAKVVCCLARGAPKGPNLPRAQLNHQDALFPGHGLATHSQTWVGLSHFYSGSVVSPKWLGSVVTLLTKHLAPKVQAPPAELGVRGDATLQTPAFTGDDSGMFFHLCQSVYRRLCKLGFQARCDNDEEFAVQMRMLPAFAVLHPAEVLDAFDGLLEVFPTEATDLAMYFEDTYIGRRRRNGVQAAMFPTSLWSVHDAVLQNSPHTNNSVPAWHRGFQSNVDCCLPNLWAFVKCLKDEQAL
ncbi:uncharacterized protein ISCGN_031377 [Ixodes scapularis]